MPKLNEILGESFNSLSDELKTKYKDIDLVDSSNYVAKDKFDQVTTEKDGYKQQIVTRDKQLLDLQGKVKDNEVLTKEIEDLKATNETTTAEYEKKFQQMKFDTAINNALKDSGAKDINLIKTLLDYDKLKVNGEEVLGLTEQLETMNKERDYLFEKKIPGTGSFTTGGNGGGEEKNKDNFASELGKQRAEVMKAKSLSDFAR